MVEVYVVHLPSKEKLEKFKETVNKLLEMAKDKKLPEGLKLKKLYFDDKNNIGLCQWEVDDINKLLEAAKQLNVDWDIKIIENPKELYKKGLF
jgi:diketogulonate reductase-like aldo/keto reductase